MDYLSLYNKLMVSRKQSKSTRILEHKTGLYFEKHHIIPRCLGGDDQQENIVLLTAKEHFIAHRLLCKIHPQNRKLAWALIQFCSKNRFHQRPPLNSIQYSSLRMTMSKANKGRIGSFLGKHHSAKTKELIRQKATGRKKSEETKQKNRIASTGRVHTAATIEKIKAAKAVVSNYTRSILSKQKIGVKNPNYGINPWENNSVSKSPKKKQLWEKREELYNIWLNMNQPFPTAFAKSVLQGKHKPHEFSTMINWFRKKHNGTL